MAPFPASKAFANGIDNIQNSSENTRVLKSKTLFNFFSQNHWKIKDNATNTSQGEGVVLKKKNGSIYKGPVIIDNKGCFSSIGGFNNDNYEMLIDIARGQNLSNINCVTGDTSYNDMIYSNFNINYACINERALDQYFYDDTSKQFICRIPNKTREIWEATYNNVSLQQNCIQPHFSYNMGLNTCQNNTGDLSQTYVGSTFKVRNDLNIWYNYTQQDNNLNYITWPIPTVDSNNPGLFYTETALSSCPQCNGGILPYRNNNDNLCILEKYSNWNLDLICNYNFGRLTNNKKNLRSLNIHNISMIPTCFPSNLNVLHHQTTILGSYSGYIFYTSQDLKTAVDLWTSNKDSAIQIYGNINTWNVENVTDMSSLFINKNSFNDDISNWKVDKVTNMDSMFYNAITFNRNISSWNVDNVTNMKNMFYTAYSFNQNISSWNVGKVTNMENMFYGAFEFNKDISSWDVSKVTSMSGMFAQAAKFNQDLSSWNVDMVTNMQSMFYNLPQYIDLPSVDSNGTPTTYFT